MRLLHLADLHLGTENYGRADPHTGLNTRLADFLRCLDAAIDCALERQVDLLVFAGDVYRSREPNPTHQREFALRVHRLASAGIPVLLVAGNHDLPALPAKASSLDVFSALEVPGVTVVREPQVLDIATRSGPVRCACMPALPRAALLRDEDRRLDSDALRRALSRRLTERLDQLAAAVGDVAPAVLVAHVGVEGALLGSEARLVSGSEPLAPLAAVAHPCYAYVALGHMHRFQELRAAAPLVVYSGSLERVDFGEEGQPKGFVAVTLDNGAASYEFAPTPARRFVTIEVDAAGKDATAEVERAIAHSGVAAAVVRVRVSIEPGQALDEERIRAGLGEAFAALPIAVTAREQATPRAPDMAERMTDPLAALEQYLGLRQVPEARARALRARAERLLVALQREAEPPAAASEPLPDHTEGAP